MSTSTAKACLRCEREGMTCPAAEFRTLHSCAFPKLLAEDSDENDTRSRLPILFRDAIVLSLPEAETPKVLLVQGAATLSKFRPVSGSMSCRTYAVRWHALTYSRLTTVRGRLAYAPTPTVESMPTQLMG